MHFGGCQKIVYNLIKNCEEQVLLFSKEGCYVDEILKENNKVLFKNRTGLIGTFSMFLSIFLLSRRYRVILHTHNRKDIGLKFLLGKKSKHIHTYHSAYRNNNLINIILKPQHAISISKTVQSYLKSYNIESRLIYNGTENEFKIQTYSHAIEDKKSRFDFVYIGRVSQEKGVYDFLLALKQLKKDTIYFNIIGDGPLLEKCIANKDNNVKIYGFQKTPWSMDFIPDVLVIPSFYEGFCLTAIEGVMFGVPIICNDIPVLRELLFFLPEACFFKINCQQSIENTIDYAVLNHEKLSKLIVSFQDVFVNSFSIHQMTLNYNQLYKTI
jgi:glycosyltransferase involved in cell wall biosynthesis